MSSGLVPSQTQTGVHAGAHEHLHVHTQVITRTDQELTEDTLRHTFQTGSRYALFLLLSGGLLVLGVIAFIVRAANSGFDEFTPWAYLMAVFAFLVTTASTAPVFAATQRMVRSHWRRPLTRASELFAVVGILSTLMFIPLVILLPAAEGRRSIWFEYPATPHAPALLAVIGLTVLGLALLWTAALPDLAAARLRATGFRRFLLNRLMLVRWAGTERQWAVLQATVRVQGALYFLMVALVHIILIGDFAEVLVPGWRDAILPASHLIGGLQSAVASTVIVLFLMHRYGGLRDYIHVDQFWGASKLLLPLSLLFFYFWFSAFIIFWYGRQPVEQHILRTFMAESYRLPFLLGLLLSSVAPFLILMWNYVRKTMLGPTLASVVILVGSFFYQVNLFVPSFNIADVRADALTELHPEPLSQVPPAVLPGAADILMIIGALGGAVFLYMLAAKVIPIMSMWEVKEGMLYRRARRFLKMNIMVMGKPE